MINNTLISTSRRSNLIFLYLFMGNKNIITMKNANFLDLANGICVVCVFIMCINCIIILGMNSETLLSALESSSKHHRKLSLRG